MKPFSLLFICCASLPIGCGSPVAENVDSDQAKRVLQTALDAWKGGKTNAANCQMLCKDDNRRKAGK